MQKFIEDLIPHDKALHLIVMGFCAMAIASFFMAIGMKDLIALAVCTTVLCQIPIFTKEWRDSKKKNGTGFSWLDVLWGEISVFIVILYTIIIK